MVKPSPFWHNCSLHCALSHKHHNPICGSFTCMESCDISLWAPFRFCPALFGCLMMWVGGRFPETCYDVVHWSHVSNVQAFPSILLGTPFVNVECIACHLQEKTGLSRSHKGIDYVLSTPVSFRNSTEFIPRVCLDRYPFAPHACQGLQCA